MRAGKPGLFDPTLRLLSLWDCPKRRDKRSPMLVYRRHMKPYFHVITKTSVVKTGESQE